MRNKKWVKTTPQAKTRETRLSLSSLHAEFQEQPNKQVLELGWVIHGSPEARHFGTARHERESRGVLGSRHDGWHGTARILGCAWAGTSRNWQ